MAKISTKTIFDSTKLTDAIGAKGWNQDRLAVEAKIDKKTVGSALKENPLSASTAGAICRALGCQVSDLQKTTGEALIALGFSAELEQAHAPVFHKALVQFLTDQKVKKFNVNVEEVKRTGSYTLIASVRGMEAVQAFAGLTMLASDELAARFAPLQLTELSVTPIGASGTELSHEETFGLHVARQYGRGVSRARTAVRRTAITAGLAIMLLVASTWVAWIATHERPQVLQYIPPFPGLVVGTGGGRGLTPQETVSPAAPDQLAQVTRGDLLPLRMALARGVVVARTPWTSFEIGRNESGKATSLSLTSGQIDIDVTGAAFSLYFPGTKHGVVIRGTRVLADVESVPCRVGVDSLQIPCTAEGYISRVRVAVVHGNASFGAAEFSPRTNDPVRLSKIDCPAEKPGEGQVHPFAQTRGCRIPLRPSGGPLVAFAYATREHAYDPVVFAEPGVAPEFGSSVAISALPGEIRDDIGLLAAKPPVPPQPPKTETVMVRRTTGNVQRLRCNGIAVSTSLGETPIALGPGGKVTCTYTCKGDVGLPDRSISAGSNTALVVACPKAP